MKSKDIRNKQLIKTAKEKPFEFDGYFLNVWENNSKEKLRYYFWLCELQQYVRIKFNVDVIIYPIECIKNDISIEQLSNIEYGFKILLNGVLISSGLAKDIYENYEIALEQGLLNSLMLIKDKK